MTVDNQFLYPSGDWRFKCHLFILQELHQRTKIIILILQNNSWLHDGKINETTFSWKTILIIRCHDIILYFIKYDLICLIRQHQCSSTDIYVRKKILSSYVSIDLFPSNFICQCKGFSLTTYVRKKVFFRPFIKYLTLSFHSALFLRKNWTISPWKCIKFNTWCLYDSSNKKI